MPSLLRLLRQYIWLLVGAVLGALFTLSRRGLLQQQHQQQAPRPVRRRIRATEQHTSMAKWPDGLAVHWHASNAQLAELDTVIRDAKGRAQQQDEAVDWAQRQRQVVGAARDAWHAYAQDAFGRDEYMPLSHTGRNFTHLGVGYIMADMLDTLWLMGLRSEYAQARDFLANQVTFDQRGAISLFETTIRLLGGLLSAFHLSGETDYKLLALADDLGTRLARSFNTTTGIPPETAILRSDGMPFATECSTSESSTLQLEFRYLAKLTGKREYQQQVDRIMDVMLAAPKYDSLVPTRIDSRTGLFTGADISLGSRGDSYYEYLLKQWLQTEQTEVDLRAEYDAAMRGVKRYLVATSPSQHLTFVGELISADDAPRFSPKMDHLVCFLAGNLALGATNGSALADVPHLSARDRDDLVLARELAETCARMYFDTESGLAPEIAYFRHVDPQTGNELGYSAHDQLVPPDGDILVPTNDRHCLLRPETVESFYILWRITGENKWRAYGWRVFEAIEKWAKLDDKGYSSLHDITQVPPSRRDSVESFFVAETLKYLFLLFADDDPLPLTKYVFSTEAHPFPRFDW